MMVILQVFRVLIVDLPYQKDSHVFGTRGFEPNLTSIPSLKPSIKQLIEREGDIDEQSEIILQMLKQWSLAPFLLKTGVNFTSSLLKKKIERSM